MERVWREADLPAGQDAYVRRLELPDGAELELAVTSAALTPRQRAEARRQVLARELDNEGRGDPDTP